MPNLKTLLLLSAISGSIYPFALAKAASKKIVILGDSLTAGYGVEKEAAFPELIKKKLLDSGRNDIEVIASGISGSTSASGPGRMKWLLKSKPDHLMIELGGNDGLRGQDLKGIKTNLRTIIQLAKENKMKTTLVAMQIPANYGAEYARGFAKLYEELAAEEKVDLIPFFFLDLQKSAKKNLLLPDGIHPNENGHRLIADKIFDMLKSKI